MARKAAKKAVKGPAKKASPVAKKIARFRAGGFSRAGIIRIIEQLERKRRSRPGYPWPNAIKNKMAEACAGRQTRKSIRDTIKAMAPNG